MRLRNVKGSREQIAANEYTIKDAEQIKGQWKDYFQDGKPIQLEIGMGKGKFLMQLAEKNPQIHYIGIEKYSSVLVRALEKMEENPLENLHFIRMDAENIVNVLIEKSVLSSDVQVLKCDKQTVDGVECLDVDFNEAFGAYVCSMGTTGEYYTIGSVVNTFLDAYGCEKVKITVEGNTLETGHAEYPGYMNRFE